MNSMPNQTPETFGDTIGDRLLDTLGQAVVAVDLNRRVIFWNRSAERVYGWSTADAVGRSVLDLIEHQPGSALLIAIRDALAAGQTWQGEIMMRRRDGDAFPALTAVSALVDNNGALLGYVGAATDNSECSNIRNELRLQKEFAQATLDALSAHVAVLDESGQILTVNRSWRAFADANPPAPPAHGVGANYLAVCEQAAGSGCETARVVADGIRAVIADALSEFELEYTCHSPSEQRWFVCRVARFSAGGHLVVSHQNISQRRRAEQENNLLLALTRGISDSESFDAALTLTLHLLCEHTGWDCGEVWLPDASQARLRLGAPSYCRTAAAADFHRAGSRFEFDPGGGLPGRVWASGRPAWIANIEQDADFSRRVQANGHGLHAAVGIPVLAGDEVIAVICFYMAQSQPEDQGSLALVAAAAAQLGSLFQRKRAQDELASSEAELRALFASMQDIVLVIDRAGCYCKVAPTNPALLAKPAHELLGRTLYDVFPAEQAQAFGQAIIQVLETQRTVRIEYELFIGDESVWFEAAISPLTEDCTLWVAHDITARRQALEAQRLRLVELEALHTLSTALRTAHDSDEVLTCLLAETVTALDAAHAAIYLAQGAAHEPRRFQASGVAPALSQAAKSAIGRVIAGGQPLPLPPDNGRSHDPAWHGVCLPIRAGTEVAGALVVAQPAPRRLASEQIGLLESLVEMAGAAMYRLQLWQRTQEQAQRVQQIIDTVPEGMLLLAADGQVLLANPAARSLAALAAFDAQRRITHLGDSPLAAILQPPAHGLWREVSVKERIFELLVQPIGILPAPDHWLLVFSEVTQARQQQRYLQAQERLATVGQMAAGIAHDFNNIMAAISLYGELLVKAAPPTSRALSYVDAIRQQAGHAVRLIGQILDFSRRAPMDMAPLDLLRLLRETARLLERTLTENIKLSVRHDHGEYVVNGDATRLQQVLMNLALNARDAMPDGGLLSFSLSTLLLAPADAPPLPNLAPGRWVRLTVCDSGVGITPDNLPHIFEPFFTTKSPDRGTGLGLAQVHGIVAQHGGAIDATSQPGQGATFTLYLPLLVAPATATVTAAAAAAPGGDETILLVEDNSAANAAVAETLRGLGYQVLTTASGAEALTILEAEGSHVALVLSDMVMPGMGGTELYRRVRQQYPAVKFLLMTGYAPDNRPRDTERDDTSSRHTAPKPPSRLQKPFAVADLATRLRELLDTGDDP